MKSASVQAIRRASIAIVPSLKPPATTYWAHRKTPNNANDPNAANDSNVWGDPNPPNDRIGFCLRAVHQKFTIVHSPNT